MVARGGGRSPVVVLRLLTAVLSLVIEPGLQGDGASAAVTHGLSCPNQGSNPGLLHWPADFFPTEPPGKHQRAPFGSLILKMLVKCVVTTACE